MDAQMIPFRKKEEREGGRGKSIACVSILKKSQPISCPEGRRRRPNVRVATFLELSCLLIEPTAVGERRKKLEGGRHARLSCMKCPLWEETRRVDVQESTSGE